MYILDLTNCNTVNEILVAVETDLNARKQLNEIKANTKKPWYKRIFG